jgi:uncharacterized protein (TIRG00374 family)
MWAGLVVSGAALVLALLGIDLPQIAETLSQAEYVFLIPAAAATVAGLATRAIRWRVLLGPQVSFSRSFWITNIGYLVSNVLPFRLGDPARAVIVGRSQEISTAAALSTVVVERVLDMLTVMALLAGLIPFVSATGSATSAGLVAGIAALVASAVLLLLAFRPDWGRWMAQQILARTSRLGLNSARWMEVLEGLLDGLAPLRSKRRGIALLAWSVVTWAGIVAFYWFMMRAFLPRPPALAAPFLVCIAALGMAVPASPGAVGVFQAAIRYGLTEVFAMPTDQAITVAFGIHAAQYMLGCALGLVGLGQESLSLGWLSAQVTPVEQPEEISSQ